ncbi:MAG: hypothetical protein M0Z66_09665 [Thermaerobacter sp.]|nr:hypothetical protein [Thermaerobacter sp.]
MADRVFDRQELAHQLRLPPRTVRRLVENYHEWLSAPQSGRFTALDLARLQIAARMSLAGRPRSAILDALATTRPIEERNAAATAAQSVSLAERRARPRPHAAGSPAGAPHRPPDEERGGEEGAAHRAAQGEPAMGREDTPLNEVADPGLEAAADRMAGQNETAPTIAPTRHSQAEVAAAATQEPLADEIGKLRDVIMQNVERERQDRDRVLMALVRTQQEVSHLRSELGTLKSRRDRKRGSVMRRLFG